jgi:hypothetical protein
MRFLVVLVLAFLTGPAFASSERETVTQTISFKGCLAAAHDLAAQVGVKLVTVIDTPNVKLFRVPGSDGTISVTCSAKERTMVLSRIPKVCGIDMAC